MTWNELLDLNDLVKVKKSFTVAEAAKLFPQFWLHNMNNKYMWCLYSYDGNWERSDLPATRSYQITVFEYDLFDQEFSTFWSIVK